MSAPLRKATPSMPSKSSEPKKRLLHIRDNIYLARKFVEGLDYEAFRDNLLIFYAVTRCLEIISEASRHLPDDMKARHPDIPWTEMAGGRKCLPSRLRGRSAASRVGHRTQTSPRLVG